MINLHSLPDVFTDQSLDWLRTMRKRRVSASRQRAKHQYSERQYECVATDDELFRFRVFMTWNTAFPRVSFSVGLQALFPSRTLMLARFNGGGHCHTNKIEGTRCLNVPHIHLTTERYMALGADPEGFAMPTERYGDAESALRCLVKDFNITGILKPDDDDFPNRDLFE